MDLYYNNQKVAILPIQPLTTIGELKKTLKDWLKPQGITDYSIKLIYNNNEELSPVVFETNTYDMVNFQSQANLINGSKIYVDKVVDIAVAKPQPTYQTCVGKEVNVLVDMKNASLSVFEDIEDGFRFFIDNFIEDKEELMADLHATGGRINYENPDVRDLLYEIMSDYRLFYETTEIQ